VVSFTLRPLYLRGKSPRYLLNRRLGGPQSRSGRDGEVKILDSSGTRTPTPRSSSLLPVATPTALSRLLIYENAGCAREQDGAVTLNSTHKRGRCHADVKLLETDGTLDIVTDCKRRNLVFRPVISGHDQIL
jgi:hypothetical protein